MQKQLLLSLFFCWFMVLTAQEEKSLAVGRTAGELAVSSTGAATYMVPLVLPPGIKEVVPALALSYNSQGGNGVAGWGWNIAGLSTISRIGATLHHDGRIDPVDFDQHDRFALDGQRLILLEGEEHGNTDGDLYNTYATENYSNIKILGHKTVSMEGGRTHKYFSVLYPDGSKAVYGETAGSKSKLEWAIQYWEDPQGNRIDYRYELDQSSTLLIQSIRYGGTASQPHKNEITFNYEDRNRQESHFIGGKEYQRSQRLSSILITTGGETYRNYELVYNQSSLGVDRLEKVVAATLEEEQPPIVFHYPNEDFSAQNLVYKKIDALDELLDLENDNLLTGDFNGDGRLDYSVQFNRQSSGFQWIFSEDAEDGSTQFSTPMMVESPVSYYQNNTIRHNYVTTTGQSIDKKLLPQNSTTRISERTILETPIYYTSNTPRSSIDFVSHTLMEDGSVDQWTKTWSNVPVNTYQGCVNEINSQRIKQYYPGDFNGDGITDILVYVQPYTPVVCSKINGVCHCYLDGEEQAAEFYWIDMARDNTTNFVHSLPLPDTKTIEKGDRIFVFDHDGDGRADLLHFKYREIAIYSITPEDQWEVLANHNKFISINPDFPFYFGDYNGDGKIDFLHPREVGTNWWVLHEATGEGFNWERVFGLPAFKISQGTNNQTFLFPQDINGDGITDLVHSEFRQSEELDRFEEELFVNKMRLNLRVFEKAVTANKFNVTQATEKEHYFDSTSKNRVYPIPVPPHQRFQQHSFAFILKEVLFQQPFSGQHSKEMLLDQISHKGMTQSIAYAPLNSQNDIYSADHSQIYPYVNINNAPNLYLVEKVTATANGQTATQKFKYKGAVSHAGGLGFLGFLATGRTNSYGTNVRALWSVSQHDPQKRGAVTQSWTSIYNHLYLPNQTSQYSSYEYSTSTTEKGVFINLPTAISTEDHLMGFETLQTYTYDAYYNPSRILTERFSGNNRQGSTDQNYTYSNSSTPTNAKYHIGRLKSEVRIERWGDPTSGRQASHTTTTQYTAYDNNLLKSMKLQGDATEWLTETMTYDAYGNLLSKVLSADGESDRSQRYTYTPDGRFLASSTDIESLTTSFLYYNDGSLKSETDPFNKTTTYTYDAWQRLQSVTDYLSNTSSTTYYWDHVDLVERQDGADGSASLRVIDPWGRERFKGQLLLNGWRYTETKYDVAGRVVMQTEPYRKNPATVVFRAGPYRDNAHTHSLRNSTQYDAYGRVTVQAMATGKSMVTTYNRGKPTTKVNDGYQEVSTTLDARGKIAQLTDPNGTIVYTYHPTGELLESNYDGHVVKVTYDGWGRKKTLSDPSAGSFSYTYDIFGQLTQEVSPWGTTDYRYDAQGKLDWKEQKGDNTNLYTDYSYDATTQLLTREETTDYWNGDSFVKTIAYDEHERPSTLTESNDWASFSQTLSYDSLGRIAQEQRNASATGAAQQSVAITHRYAANGQLDALLANQKKVWELKAENARGQATQVQLGNGITKINAFDALGFLEDTTHGSVFKLDLNYNKKKGVLNSRTQKGHAKEVFTHDSRNRLTQVLQDSLQRKYSYDTYGRMSKNSRVGEYHYTNPNDRYVLDSLFLNAHGKKFYEEHPRQTAQYNIDRKATQVHQEGHGIANFIYNSSGQRLHAFYGNEEEDWSERKYRKHYSTLFPAEITVNQETEEAKTLMYLGGDAYTAPVVLINSQDHYLHRDHLGSILAISNSSATAVEERHFTPWGEVDYFAKNGIVQEKFEDSILPRGFTGHEHFEQVTLIHMNGRLYDPQLRRFIAPDNNIQDPFDTRSYDRKAYVWNNPLMASDPSGEFIIEAIIISLVTNGFNNISNGRGFFEGAVKAVALGIIAGGISFGIGEAAFGIKTSLITSGVSQASSAAITKGFQAIAHGILGGIMSTAHGGSFGSGFLSGAVGSLAGDLGKSLFGGSFIGTTLSGGFAGGLASLAAGGEFWDGFRNGAISAGLNHALHSAQMASKQNDKGWQNYFDQVAQQAELGLATVEAGIGGAQLGAIGYRQTLSIHQKVGSYRSFAATYSRLGAGAKLLGRASNYVLAPITVGLDYQAMQAGQLSGGRFAYRTGSTLTAIGAGFALGGPPGALLSGTISVFSISGEYIYDHVIVPFGREINYQFSQFSNALNNGWRPR